LTTVDAKAGRLVRDLSHVLARVTSVPAFRLGSHDELSSCCC
jgi:hypothetical protein